MQVTPCQYSYKVKVFNPTKRKAAVIRQLHDFKGQFKTVAQLKAQIFQELADELPKDASADVGYFEGKQSSKIWIVSIKDLDSMYQKAKNENDFFLWIQTSDSDSDGNEPVKKKKKSGSSRQEKEGEVDEIYEKLKKKHDGSYTSPQLKLWARMVHCGTHDDYDDPPQVPMITGTQPKNHKKDSFTAAITGAAEAVAKVLSPQPVSLMSSSESSGNMGISPGKSTELRMKNLEQLRVLQQLYEENILSDSEFSEQKSIVLKALRKLS